MYMFYTEEEIKNIISRKEMSRVILSPIHEGDKDVMVKISDNGFVKMTIADVAEYIRSGSHGTAEDGGILINSNN